MRRGQHKSIWRLLWRAVDLTALLPLVISLCALQGTMAGARAAPSDPSKPPQSAGIYDPDLNHTDEEGNGLSQIGFPRNCVDCHALSVLNNELMFSAVAAFLTPVRSVSIEPIARWKEESGKLDLLRKFIAASDGK